MRSNRLSKLIVAIGTMALAIALTINAEAAAPQAAFGGKALFDQHDHHQSFAFEAVTTLDIEQARINWRASTPVASAQNSTGYTLDQQSRDAIQARWLARHGRTNRTCVLLCGGW